MTLTRRATTGLIEVHAPEFMAFVHARRHPCPLFHWDGAEPLEYHHLGQPGERGWSMRRRNDGLGVLIPQSVHARHTTWEAQDDGRLLAAAVAYALADFLAWLVDPHDTEPRLGDPLVNITRAALILAQRYKNEFGVASSETLRLLHENRLRVADIAGRLTLDADTRRALRDALQGMADAEKALMDGRA